MPPSLREDPVETVDIMPTVAAMLAVPLAPGFVDGHCLNGVAGVSCPR
jgi:arylsulfatase A-like enzyme